MFLPAFSLSSTSLSMLLLILLLTLSLICLLLAKLRRVHLLLHDVRDLARSSDDRLFRQLEALQGLYVELQLEHSLPPTRGWAGSPDFLLEVARQVRTARPATVIECSSGVSTVVIARCLQRNGSGKLYSLEHDAGYAILTRAQLLRHGLQDWATVLDAPLVPQALAASQPWYDLASLPSATTIDLLVIDGPPQDAHALARYPAAPLLFARLAPGAQVFLDDANRSDEQAALRRWAIEFPALAQAARSCEKGCAVLTATSAPLPPLPPPLPLQSPQLPR